MSRANPEPVSIAIMAKAPIPGLAKTRLIPVVGAHAAAVLQRRLTERTVEIATSAMTGPVTLWATPDATHGSFQELAACFPVSLACQPDGDLGARMLAAVMAANGPALVIGTDCPALTTGHLNAAVNALREGSDVAVIPAEDGGYVLIGMRAPQPVLFADIAWGTSTVMDLTRRKIAAAGLRCHELATLWDVDDEVGYDRLEREFPGLAL